MKPTETQILNQIQQYLRLKRIFHYRNNSGGALLQNKPDGRKYRVQFGVRGMPDIVAVVNGIYVGFEVKTAIGKQSPHQKLFQDNLTHAGGRYFIIRSLDDLIEAMRIISTNSQKNSDSENNVAE